MRRLWAAVLSAVALVLLAPAAASAEKFNAFSEDELEGHGWEPQTYNEGVFQTGDAVTIWCKTVTDATGDDRDTFPINEESAQEVIGQFAYRLSSGLPQGGDLEGIEEDSDYVMLCVDPENSEPEEDFFCVYPNVTLPPINDDNGDPIILEPRCWDSENERNQSWIADAADTVADPAGAIADSTFGQWATDLEHGVRWFMAMLLYWWILIPHADLEQSTAAVMWPPLLGLGMAIGILLLIWQGVKMMFSGKAPLLMVDTLKGLAYFAIWCIFGITFIGTLSHASEGLTAGILRYSLDSAEIGCAQYQANERQPDGLKITFPEPDTSNMTDAEADEAATHAEIGRAFGTCAASQMAVEAAYSGWIMLFYIIAFIVSLFQGLLLFIREAALPVMALLLPIAAAGQIGGATTKRWLPNLVTMTITLLAYKPMVALVFAVGFTSSTLSDNVVDILRGLLTLLVGVIAPAVLLKAFKPIATQGIEDVSSMSSVANNAFMATQVGGSINQWMEKRAGQQASQAAQAHAASQAAHQGGGLVMDATKTGSRAATAGVGAATAATPLGLVSKIGKAIQGGIKFLAGKSEGVKPEEAARSGRLAQHQSGDQAHQPGTQAGHTGLQMRESGTPYGSPGSPSPHPGQPGSHTSGQPMPMPHGDQGPAGRPEAPAPPPHPGQDPSTPGPHPLPPPGGDPGPGASPAGEGPAPAGERPGPEAPSPPAPLPHLPPTPSNDQQDPNEEPT